MRTGELTEVAQRRDDGGAVLTVSGELDVATAPQLRNAVGDLLGQGVRHVELDLGGCTFIDSTGLGAMLWAAHRLQAAGGDLRTVNIHGVPARAIEASGLGELFPVDR